MKYCLIGIITKPPAANQSNQVLLTNFALLWIFVVDIHRICFLFVCLLFESVEEYHNV